MSLFPLALLISAVQALPAVSLNETSVASSVEAFFSDSQRSLWNIISSCLLTVFACVYTAIHPNVPSPYDGPSVKLRRTAVVMLAAVLVPELIVVWAARQWISARAFTKDMRECLAQRDSVKQGSVFAQRQQSSDSIISTGHARITMLLPMEDKAPHGGSETKEGNELSGQAQGSGGFVIPSIEYNVSGKTIVGLSDNGEPMSEALPDVKRLNGSRSPLQLAERSVSFGSVQPLGSPITQPEDREDETWTITHSFYAYMGGFMVYYDGQPWRTITPLRLLQAIKDGNISPIKLTKDEIADASKGDFISKGLVVLQATWFCVQLLARRAYNLAITPLEIGTAGFAVLCFITYALWWNKPLNVNHPRRLKWKIGVPPGDLHYDPYHYRDHRSYSPVDLLRSLLGISVENPQLRRETFGGDNVEPPLESRWKFSTVCLIGLVASTVFGLMHVTAWDLPFPTRTEQIMWHVGAVLIVYIPLQLALLNGLFFYLKFQVPALAVINRALPIPYVVSRITLIVIMFTSLRSLPPSAFETMPWAESIPHL